jgi:Tol biopolymer transport system component
VDGGPAGQITRGGYSTRMDYAPDGRRIVYQAHDGVGFDIHVIAADGGASTRLTDAAGDETQPRWSPDGARVAFVSGAAPDRELHVVAAGGGPATRLSREGDIGGFDWLPDGSGLVYSLTEAAANIWRVDVGELLDPMASSAE